MFVYPPSYYNSKPPCGGIEHKSGYLNSVAKIAHKDDSCWLHYSLCQHFFEALQALSPWVSRINLANVMLPSRVVMSIPISTDFFHQWAGEIWAIPRSPLIPTNTFPFESNCLNRDSHQKTSIIWPRSFPKMSDMRLNNSGDMSCFNSMASSGAWYSTGWLGTNEVANAIAVRLVTNLIVK